MDLFTWGIIQCKMNKNDMSNLATYSKCQESITNESCLATNTESFT